MGMELPGTLTGPLALIGMEWPEGDETALDRMSDHWTTFGSDVNALTNDLTTLAGGILSTIEGPTHDALSQHLQQFFTGDKSLDQLQKEAQYLAECSTNTANEILTLKIFYIVELVALAAFIAAAIASAWINWGAPAEIAAAEMATQFSLRAAIEKAVQQIITKLAELSIENIGPAIMRSIGANTLKDVAVQLSIKAGVGALSGSGMEFTKQLTLHLAADKDVDWGNIALAGVQGAGANILLAPAALPINNAFGKKFGAEYFENKMRWLPVADNTKKPGGLDFFTAGKHVVTGAAAPPTTAAFKAMLATTAVTAIPSATVKKIPGLDGATSTGDVGKTVWQELEADEKPVERSSTSVTTTPTVGATPTPNPGAPPTPTTAAAPGSVPPPPPAPAPVTP